MADNHVARAPSNEGSNDGSEHNPQMLSQNAEQIKRSILERVLPDTADLDYARQFEQIYSNNVHKKSQRDTLDRVVGQKPRTTSPTLAPKTAPGGPNAFNLARGVAYLAEVQKNVPVNIEMLSNGTPAVPLAASFSACGTWPPLFGGTDETPEFLWGRHRMAHVRHQMETICRSLGKGHTWV